MFELTACHGTESDLHPSGSRPSAAIAESPNAFDDIQVGERMKTVMLTPSTGWRLGTICIELEPFPITPTRLFRKSYLDLVSSPSPARQNTRSLGAYVCVYVCVAHHRSHIYSLLVPLSRVQQLASKRFKPGYLWPCHLVQLAPSRDDKVNVIFLDRLASVGFLHLNSPLLGLGVPRTPDYLVLGLDEAHSAKLFRDALQVVLDLSTRGIQRRPVGVGRERVLVGMSLFLLKHALEVGTDSSLHGISQAKPPPQIMSATKILLEYSSYQGIC